jgi:NADPH:quinone reductase
VIPPHPKRGVTVRDVYVRADGADLAVLATALDEGLLSVDVSARLPLTDAAAALDGAVSRRGGATVLLP